MKSHQHSLADKAALMERLRSEFHITTMFIPVKTLAGLIGMSPSALYNHIRRGEFFLPVRHINKTPLVSVEDFASWYLNPAHIDYGGSLAETAMELEAAAPLIDIDLIDRRLKELRRNQRERR